MNDIRISITITKNKENYESDELICKDLKELKAEDLGEILKTAKLLVKQQSHD